MRNSKRLSRKRAGSTGTCTSGKNNHEHWVGVNPLCNITSFTWRRDAACLFWLRTFQACGIFCLGLLIFCSEMSCLHALQQERGVRACWTVAFGWHGGLSLISNTPLHTVGAYRRLMTLRLRGRSTYIPRVWNDLGRSKRKKLDLP